MRVDLPPGLAPVEELRLGRDGRWYHDGDPIRHARLCGLLDRSVARDEGGQLVVTTGRDRLPFVSEDAPLRVKTARLEGGGFVQVLRDGREVTLTNDSALCIDGAGRVRSRLAGPREGEFWALWERPAVQALMPLLEDDETGAHVALASGRVALSTTSAPRDWTR